MVRGERQRASSFLRSPRQSRTSLASGIIPSLNHELTIYEKRVLVTLFDSFADRDLSAKMGFGQMISMGTDRMAAHLKTLQGEEDNG